MSKTHGLGATINVDNSSGTPSDITGDVNSFQFATPRAVQDVTGVGSYAMERLLLLADFSMGLNGTVNTALSHVVFEDVADADTARTTKIQPIAAATPYISPEVLYTDYAWNRANDGSLTWTAPGVLADGVVPVWVNA